MKKPVMEEARRCLQCKRPQCGVRCPVRIHVRNSILLLLKSKVSEAEKQFFDSHMMKQKGCNITVQKKQAGVIQFPLKAGILEAYYEDCCLHIYQAASPDRAYSTRESNTHTPGPFCSGCCQDWES